MHSRRRRRAAFLVVVLVVGGGVPAWADGAVSEKRGKVIVGAPANTLCGHQHALQSHGGAWFGRSARTTAIRKTPTGGCPSPDDGAVKLPTGWIIERGAVYKTPALGVPGTLCVQGGWVPNPADTWDVYWSTNENPSAWCNFGGGSLTVTHDVESGLWISTTNSYWYGTLGYPTTSHRY